MGDASGSTRENEREDHPAARGEREPQEGADVHGEREDGGAAFSQALDGRSDERGLHEARKEAVRGKRGTDHALAERVALHRVEGPHRRVDRTTEQVQEERSPNPERHVRASHREERAERVGVCEREGPAFVGRERLGQDDVPVQRVDEREAGGDEERNAVPEAPEETAERRSEHEPHAECRADEPERATTVFGLRDVGDVGVRGRIRTTADARDDAACEEPGDRRGERGEGVVDAEADDGRKQERPATVGVREAADDGSRDELHEGIGRKKPSRRSRRRPFPCE